MISNFRLSIRFPLSEIRQSTLRFAVVASVMFYTGCVSLASLIPNYEYPDYSMRLTSVQRPESARERYGPERLAVISDSGKTKFTFDDSLVRITMAPTTDGFAFRLDNKTFHSVRIIWDDAAIVDPTGESGRVMHNGVKYTDRNNSQPPTVIVARGFVTDIAVPTENVSLSSGLYGGWTTSPFLPRPPMDAKNRDAVLANLKDRFRGRSVALLLPLQIEGFTNDYLFTFSILDVRGGRSAESAAAEESTPVITQIPIRATDTARTSSGGQVAQRPASRPRATTTLPAAKSAEVGGPSSATRGQATIGAPLSEADRDAAVRAFEEGNAYVGTHEWAKAEQSFQKALLLDGSVAKYHAAMGSLMMLLHRWVDAEAAYSAAVLLDVDNPDYRRALKEARARR